MQQRIRIMHVISSLELGGAQAVLSDLVRVLSPDTYEQVVVYFHHGPYVDRLQKLGVSVYQVRGGVCTYDLLFWWRTLCLMRSFSPDVIHASLWSAGFVSRIIGRLIGIPVVSAVHALLQHHGRLRSLLDRITVCRDDTFIAVSQEVASSVTQTFPYQVVRVVPNGIDNKYIHQIQKETATYAIPGLSPDHFVIGSVGRFVPVKRYDLLLRLFAQLASRYKQVRLLLIGAGPLEHVLRAQAIQLGVDDKVFFVIGQSALGLYPRMDCFVQTSLYEGLSIALLEAMTTGRACITTSQDAQHAVIEHDVNGWIVRADNTQQIVDYIEQLVRNPLLCRDLGLRASATVANQYSIQAMQHGYEASFAAVIKNRI